MIEVLMTENVLSCNAIKPTDENTRILLVVVYKDKLIKSANMHAALSSHGAPTSNPSPTFIELVMVGPVLLYSQIMHHYI
jgi:hypothetical protein